jgi:hypothetical protein
MRLVPVCAHPKVEDDRQLQEREGERETEASEPKLSLSPVFGQRGMIALLFFPTFVYALRCAFGGTTDHKKNPSF